MKTPPLNLTEIFNKTLSALYAAEKKYLKCFEQMAEAALTDELRTAVSPIGTELETHIGRLAQIIELLKLKPSRISAVIDDELLKLAKEVCGFSKQQSVLKDIQILHCAKLITYSKVAVYESVFFMANTLKLEHPALLLEQCLKDNKNAAGYLTQIEQNIIYPSAKRME